MEQEGEDDRNVAVAIAAEVMGGSDFILRSLLNDASSCIEMTEDDGFFRHCCFPLAVFFFSPPLLMRFAVFFVSVHSIA